MNRLKKFIEKFTADPMFYMRLGVMFNILYIPCKFEKAVRNNK